MLIKNLFKSLPLKKDENWKYFDFSIFNEDILEKTRFSLKTDIPHFFIKDYETQYENFINKSSNIVEESYILRGVGTFDLTLISGVILKEFNFYIPEFEFSTLNLNIFSNDLIDLCALINFKFKINGTLELNINSDIVDGIIFEQILANIGENGKLVIKYISSGIRCKKSFIHIKQQKESYLDLKYRSFLLSDNITDLVVISESLDEKCYSNHDIKCVLNDSSTFSCSGEIIISEKANNSEAYHYNSTLALSNDIRINAKPILKISNGNVKCSHGAPSFYIRDEDLFYMRSRGINRKNSEIMFIKSFLNESSSIIEKSILKGV